MHGRDSRQINHGTHSIINIPLCSFVEFTTRGRSGSQDVRNIGPVAGSRANSVRRLPPAVRRRSAVRAWRRVVRRRSHWESRHSWTNWIRSVNIISYSNIIFTSYEKSTFISLWWLLPEPTLLKRVMVYKTLVNAHAVVSAWRYRYVIGELYSRQNEVTTEVGKRCIVCWISCLMQVHGTLKPCNVRWQRNITTQLCTFFGLLCAD